MQTGRVSPFATRRCTHQLAQRILEAKIAQTLLHVLDLVLITGWHAANGNLGELGSLVLAHVFERLLFQLTFESRWDAEAVMDGQR